MTVVAYDGLYVAADRLITNDSGMSGVTRKLQIHEHEVVTSTGAADHGEALAYWYVSGKDPAKYPHQADGGEKGAYLYVFGFGQPVMCFQTWPTPILFPMAQFASGCARDIAMTALHLGKDAREAAQVACELNVYCGGGIDYVDLRELKGTGKATVRSYTR